eukprot:1126656-Pyramimonas_sp.AAC.1
MENVGQCMITDAITDHRERGLKFKSEFARNNEGEDLTRGAESFDSYCHPRFTGGSCRKGESPPQKTKLSSKKI